MADRNANIIGTVILAIALWPIAHYQLVMRYDVDPWRMNGFAMYCTHHGISLELFDVSDGLPRTIATGEVTEAANRRIEHFIANRRTLGRLHSPEALARALFASRPETRRLQIVVTVSRLRWMDTRIRPERTTYSFDRAQFAGSSPT